MIELLQSLSGANKVLSETFEDLPMVLERAISIPSLEGSGCPHFGKARVWYRHSEHNRFVDIRCSVLPFAVMNRR